jgi:glutathione synthase/RimK-type ligase-like ATP-grasp enzyme
MTKTNIFDVLIVYSHRKANSAGNLSAEVITPFPEGKSCGAYNLVYGYFLKVCRDHKLKAAFTTSADISDAGECTSYWLFEKGRWIKVRESCYSRIIFDKFSPTSKKIKAGRKLLFSSGAVRPFNEPELYKLFFDKQKTYRKLSSYGIPTVTLKDYRKRNINLACKKLNKIILKHAHADDFSGEIVMKDRFGAGGRRVYKFKGNDTGMISARMKKNKHASYIIQPFVNFDKGYQFQNAFVAADIRLIFMGGKAVQAYIRMAKKDEFRCNEHRGGTLKYLPLKSISKKVTAYADEITKHLGNDSSLYTLDFIVSNNGNIYFLEGNTSPGLDWNLVVKENEKEAHRLIRLIVKELASRVKENSADTGRTPLLRL